MSVSLRPHQVTAVEKMHSGCILNGRPGTGKTITSLAYFITKECGGDLHDVRGSLDGSQFPDVYVITTAKKRDTLDWQRDALKLDISTERSLSAGGVQLTVDSWNNIEKYREVENAFFIFDEQRLVGSGAWVKAFTHIAKHNRWVMLSATPGDTWMDYIPVFCANGWYRNRTDFIRQHVIWKPFTKFPQVDRFVEEAKLEAHKRAILVDMPYESHTVRETKDVWVSYDIEKFRKAFVDRWHVYEERPLRDVSELFLVMRKIVNSDPSRIRAVKKLLTVHPRMIIFYTFDYELEILRNGLSTSDLLGTSVAEWNGHRHDPLPHGERWVYLVQYAAGSEGWNCTTTDTVVFYSLTYSYKQFFQAKGRIDRLDTPFTVMNYYILRSKSAIDRAIAKALSQKRSFNERKWLPVAA